MVCLLKSDNALFARIALATCQPFANCRILAYSERRLLWSAGACSRCGWGRQATPTGDGALQREVLGTDGGKPPGRKRRRATALQKRKDPLTKCWRESAGKRDAEGEPRGETDFPWEGVRHETGPIRVGGECDAGRAVRRWRGGRGSGAASAGRRFDVGVSGARRGGAGGGEGAAVDCDGGNARAAGEGAPAGASRRSRQDHVHRAELP